MRFSEECKFTVNINENCEIFLDVNFDSFSPAFGPLPLDHPTPIKICFSSTSIPSLNNSCWENFSSELCYLVRRGMSLVFEID